jgi:hypothetical protein
MVSLVSPGGESFKSQLNDVAGDNVESRVLPDLLLVAEGLRSGTIEDAILQHYKSLVVDFIRTELEVSSESIQDAFFLFVLRSNMAVEIPAVRAEMSDLIRRNLGNPITSLLVNLAVALLRSRKPPAATIIKLLFEKAKESFDSQPRWLFVPILVEAAKWQRETEYKTTDLVADVAKLSVEADFEKAVSLRNPIWQSLDPPTDAISIISIAKGSTDARYHTSSSAQTAIWNFTRQYGSEVKASIS